LRPGGGGGELEENKERVVVAFLEKRLKRERVLGLPDDGLVRL
jgi:hypothetical protein